MRYFIMLLLDGMLVLSTASFGAIKEQERFVEPLRLAASCLSVYDRTVYKRQGQVHYTLINHCSYSVYLIWDSCGSHHSGAHLIRPGDVVDNIWCNIGDSLRWRTRSVN